MKETKFRGKIISSENVGDVGKWAFGSLLKAVEQACIVPQEKDFETNFYDLVEVDPKTVGQFTGLRDKNGKDIYEGDAVILQNEQNGKCYAIDFKDGYFGFSRLSEFLGYYLRYKIDGRAEVIGNIHDNPELVE